MPKYLTPEILGQIRTVLAIAGGLLAARGYFAASLFEPIFGLIIAIWVSRWSWKAKSAPSPEALQVATKVIEADPMLAATVAAAVMSTPPKG